MSSQPAVPSGPDDESAIRHLAASLRRRMAILVLAIIALPAGALAYSLTAEKQYTATAKLLFRDPGFDQRLFGGQVLAPSVDPAREAATNVGLVSLDTVAQRSAASIRGRQLTAEELQRKVSVAAQGQSNVVAVEATDPDPAFAALLANTVASQYIVFRREADRRKISQAVTLVRRQLAGLSPEQRSGREGRSLSQQVEQLGVLAALQTGNAERVQRAEVPDEPSSPQLLRNVILALLVGIVLGVGMALLRERLDRRLHDREHAEALLGRPVLGEIPESPALGRDGGGGLQLDGQEAEAFRTLRANLRYYDVDHDVRSLLITSSAPDDGKSTVARFLAATAAAAGATVILVEADLRRPTLKTRHPKLLTKGLSEVLTGQSELAGSVQELPITIHGVTSNRTLHVITAGALPPNPTDLLESDRMRAVISELERRYELVVIDSSPVTVVPDSIPLLRQVSGVLVVLCDDRTTTDGARMLRDQLAHLGATPLGLVLNRTSPVNIPAYYGYYSYAPPSANGSKATNGAALVSPRQRRRARREEAQSEAPGT
ncbi:MAG: tyrosine-protein kinase [Thermoleophilaceae bacterium]|nr:tyrosine-protein kinase [Thermoleophilaceae bacterium]